MKIEQYTIGMGDRFAHQGIAQLRAVMQARDLGIPVHPVWNKSNREHAIVHSKPDDLRAEADAAVAALGWSESYHVDADHIGLKTVDGFLNASDFFTLDVADFVGRPSAGTARFQDFIRKWGSEVQIPGMGRPLGLTPAAIEKSAAKFLQAMVEAGAIYRHVLANKNNGDFVVEVSVDETDSPQTPDELFLIAGKAAEVRTLRNRLGVLEKDLDHAQKSLGTAQETVKNLENEIGPFRILWPLVEKLLELLNKSPLVQKLDAKIKALLHEIGDHVKVPFNPEIKQKPSLETEQEM